ncbi:hypothetical protein BELL_0383g00090 [Botrytis elliptica]|uniref:Uncharacterized protein n=1 Tax=Botrytis elliptica TaxID=278938 RepID=A0A4Z1JIN1_9HELO|nr:hypothetical protein BELL_0383g00090 [Botrytis elliptica]
MPTNTSKLSNSNRILKIFDPNQEYQSDSDDDMVNVREVTVEHRQEIAQLRRELTAEHRQEIDQARQETIQARQETIQETIQLRRELTAEYRQEIDQARQENIQLRQELTTTHTKVATLEEKLIHKVAHNEELQNQLRDCKEELQNQLNERNESQLLLREERYGCQAQASDIEIQKLKKHIQSLYIILTGLLLVLGLLAIVLLWKN